MNEKCQFCKRLHWWNSDVTFRKQGIRFQELGPFVNTPIMEFVRQEFVWALRQKQGSPLEMSIATTDVRNNNNKPCISMMTIFEIGDNYILFYTRKEDDILKRFQKHPKCALQCWLPFRGTLISAFGNVTIGKEQTAAAAAAENGTSSTEQSSATSKQQQHVPEDIVPKCPCQAPVGVPVKIILTEVTVSNFAGLFEKQYFSFYSSPPPPPPQSS